MLALGMQEETDLGLAPHGACILEQEIDKETYLSFIIISAVSAEVWTIVGTHRRVPTNLGQEREQGMTIENKL